MNQHAGEALELTIEKMAPGGAGLARHQGRVIFVEGGLAGSRVSVGPVREERGALFAQVSQVLSPSPCACQPPCPDFGECGGCAWQHAAYAAQLAWKRDIVAEQMARLGKIDIQPAPTIPSPMELGYRNKMEFAFVRGPRLGLRARRDPRRVVEVRSCLLMEPPAMDILEAIRRYAAQSGLAAYDPRTGAGVWRYAVLRRSLADGRWLVHLIVSDRAKSEALRPLGQALLERFSLLAGVVLGHRKDRSDYAQAQRRGWCMGQGFLGERLDGLWFDVSAESFFQTNTLAAEALVRAMLRAAGPVEGLAVWDLYCGAGSLSLPLARAGAKVTGFEQNGQAVRDGAGNASRNALPDAVFHTADILDVLKNPGPKPDLIVLDPPRAGLHPEACALLAGLGVKRMVYVSCNPATLARDLARLAPFYTLAGLTPVDMFPHTPHVECVAELLLAG